jgi:hypothetical protein
MQDRTNRWLVRLGCIGIIALAAPTVTMAAPKANVHAAKKVRVPPNSVPEKFYDPGNLPGTDIPRHNAQDGVE